MASTIILSDNGVSSGTSGYKITAGNDGVLILQTTTSGGTATNAIVINTTQQVGIGKSPSDTLDILKNDTTGPSIALSSSSATSWINQWGSVGGGTGRTNRFEINAASTLMSLCGGSAVTFQVGSVGDANEKARVNTYGLGLGGAVPSSGMGITFPAVQSASSDANTLDDYEEGTWTPTLGRTLTDPTVSYSTRVGTYVKIGRMVYIFWDVTASSLTGGSGSIALKGLPFSIASSDTVMAGYSLIHHRDASLITSAVAGGQLKGYWERGTTYGVAQVDYSGTSGFGTANDPTYGGSGRWTGWGAYVAQS